LDTAGRCSQIPLSRSRFRNMIQSLGWKLFSSYLCSLVVQPSLLPYQLSSAAAKATSDIAYEFSSQLYQDLSSGSSNFPFCAPSQTYCAPFLQFAVIPPFQRNPASATLGN
jgi:hypothetical protein